MSAVKHCQVDDDSAQEAAFERTQEEACGHQATKRLGEAEKGAHDTPRRDQGGQVNASPDALDDPVTGHVDKDIGDVEDEQSNVEFGTRLHSQVLGQPVDFGIADVGSINEGEEPAQTVSCGRGLCSTGVMSFGYRTICQIGMGSHGGQTFGSAFCGRPDRCRRGSILASTPRRVSLGA